MIVRIPQRTQDDCAICTVAMVMGPPYSYERVLADSANYPKISADGKFYAWWESYIREEGFESIYCHFNGLHALGQYGGAVAGMLGMDIPHLRTGSRQSVNVGSILTIGSAVLLGMFALLFATSTPTTSSSRGSCAS